MKNKYQGSFHDLMTNVDAFRCQDSNHVYRLKRVNEFGDAYLMHYDTKDNCWVCAGNATMPRKGMMQVDSYNKGLTMSIRIRLNTLEPLTEEELAENRNYRRK